MRIIDCRCGRTLSVQNPDGSYEMRYKGRILRYWPPATVTCQRCGFTVALDKEREALVS